MREFNTTGTCYPQLHYMVDITNRLGDIEKRVAKGEYITINRGRQYGKTTTLNALETFLTPDYLVISMDFQLLSNSDFSTEEKFVSAFAREMYRNELVRKAVGSGIADTLKKLKSGKDLVLADLFDVSAQRSLFSEHFSINRRPWQRSAQAAGFCRARCKCQRIE